MQTRSRCSSLEAFFYLIIFIMSKLDHDGAIYFKSIALIKEGIDALVNFNAAHFSE